MKYTVIVVKAMAVVYTEVLQFFLPALLCVVWVGEWEGSVGGCVGGCVGGGVPYRLYIHAYNYTEIVTHTCNTINKHTSLVGAQCLLTSLLAQEISLT